ncbi:MAG: pyridoxamine 5'-phosphate oxidase family protein [Lachnospiraceae bacterium]|nr:pyridoxamine 5'-phosphate oxidase family protein [Lachnospiraceae bacterium]
MFRKMRRKKQLLSEESCLEILEKGTSGVLALVGDEGYPYAVPLSYVYRDGKIIFHGAKQGHKVDAVKENGKCSFCVIDQDLIVPEEYTTYFRSVIAFGKVRVVEDADEMRRLVSVLAEKYRPEFLDERMEAINKEFPALCVMVLEVEHMTGKEAIELVRKS